jgi:hypothetical protein
MTAKWPFPFVLVFGLTITRAADPTVTIDTASPSGKVSPLFYGLMTEEINHAYGGGLYAELVRNRAFLDDAPQQRIGRSFKPTGRLALSGSVSAGFLNVMRRTSRVRTGGPETRGTPQTGRCTWASPPRGNSFAKRPILCGR